MINFCRSVILRSAWEPSIFRPCGLESRARRRVAAVEGARNTGPYSSAYERAWSSLSTCAHVIGYNNCARACSTWRNMP